MVLAEQRLYNMPLGFLIASSNYGHAPSKLAIETDGEAVMSCCAKVTLICSCASVSGSKVPNQEKMA